VETESARPCAREMLFFDGPADAAQMPTEGLGASQFCLKIYARQRFSHSRTASTSVELRSNLLGTVAAAICDTQVRTQRSAVRHDSRLGHIVVSRGSDRSAGRRPVGLDNQDVDDGSRCANCIGG
jgi:hypothetical protein